MFKVIRFENDPPATAMAISGKHCRPQRFAHCPEVSHENLPRSRHRCVDGAFGISSRIKLYCCVIFLSVVCTVTTGGLAEVALYTSTFLVGTDRPTGWAKKRKPT